MDSEDLFVETPELAGHLDGIDGETTPSNGHTNGHDNHHGNGVVANGDDDDDDETQMSGIDDELLAGAAAAAAVDEADVAVAVVDNEDAIADQAANGDDETEFDEAAVPDDDGEAEDGDECADDDATEMLLLEDADAADEAESAAQEQPATTATAATAAGEQRLTQLPLSRIRALMKLNPDAGLASSEAIFLMCKATELFIESLTKESFVYTAEARKRTVQRKDVEKAIESVDALMFLEGALV